MEKFRAVIMQQELSISTKQSMDKQQAPIMCCVGFQIFRKDIRRRMAHVFYHNWENCMIYLPHNRLTATSATWPVIKMLCIGRTSLRTARFHIQVLVDVYDCLVAVGKSSRKKNV